MNVIDYITITCNLKNGRLQITSDYMKKCNRLQLITNTNDDYPMSVTHYRTVKQYTYTFYRYQIYFVIDRKEARKSLV